METVNKLFKSFGLTRRRIEPRSIDLEADTLTTTQTRLQDSRVDLKSQLNKAFLQICIRSCDVDNSVGTEATTPNLFPGGNNNIDIGATSPVSFPDESNFVDIGAPSPVSFPGEMVLVGETFREEMKNPNSSAYKELKLKMETLVRRGNICNLLEKPSNPCPCCLVWEPYTNQNLVLENDDYQNFNLFH